MTSWFHVEIRVGCSQNTLDNSTVNLLGYYEYDIFTPRANYIFDSFNELCNGRCGAITYAWQINGTTIPSLTSGPFLYDPTSRNISVYTTDYITYNDTTWKISIDAKIFNLQYGTITATYDFYVYLVFKCYVNLLLPPPTAS